MFLHILYPLTTDNHRYYQDTQLASKILLCSVYVLLGYNIIHAVSKLHVHF